MNTTSTTSTTTTSIDDTVAQYNYEEDLYECPMCGAEPYTGPGNTQYCRCDVCGWEGRYADD